MLLGCLLTPRVSVSQVRGTPAEALATLPDFKVEVVKSADGQKNGSWISMTKDSKGRLLLGGQARQPITRLTLENGKVVKEEILKAPVSEVMGMLFVGDALYVDGQGKDNSGKNVYGLFRLHDPAGDGSYSSIEFLREWVKGSGEHGAHAINLGPDKKLYIVCGNFVGQPGDLLPSSPHRNYADDRALPRAEDGNGFGAGNKPPGGSIFRMDLDGKNAEVFASGDRNTYDVAFNADGEILGFDSDMEWDWGMPWYRPIRVYHAPSGADMGFREGTGKWPTYYPDSLPPVVEIGIGCPTGVAFGYGAKFPAKYQKAMYILDWTYGRLMAVHVKPKGSTYESTGWENFVAPKALGEIGGRKTPLNLTDVVIGDDGAMYFSAGGRNTQANLYRVTYTGRESTAAVDPHDADGAQARALRHQLEAFHGRADTKAIDTAWPHLGDEDRFIRYAARLAIESQPIEQWKSKALAETNPQAAVTALLSVARLGGKESQAPLIAALAKVPDASLSESQMLEKLRVLEVSISRDGKPGDEQAKAIVAELDPLFPAKTFPLNSELCQVLLALDAPAAVSKTVGLLNATPIQEEQINYVLFLRTIKTGWTPELRKDYFTWFTKSRAGVEHWPQVTRWFQEAGIRYSDGSSFPKFIASFHRDAKTTLTPEEAKTLEPVLVAYNPPTAGRQPARRAIPPHAFVKEWTMADIEPLLPQVSKGRNFQLGQDAYAIGNCAACHRFANAGGAIGPDLSAISTRFQRRDILESIIDPSKVVSEQYMNTAFRLKSGDTIIGRVLEENDQQAVVRPNPLTDDKVTVKKTDIDVRKLSTISPMPAGAVNTLSKEEILDLIAYLESGGQRDHADFQR